MYAVSPATIGEPATTAPPIATVHAGTSPAIVVPVAPRCSGPPWICGHAPATVDADGACVHAGNIARAVIDRPPGVVAVTVSSCASASAGGASVPPYAQPPRGPRV